MWRSGGVGRAASVVMCPGQGDLPPRVRRLPGSPPPAHRVVGYQSDSPRGWGIQAARADRAWFVEVSAGRTSAWHARKRNRVQRGARWVRRGRTFTTYFLEFFCRERMVS